MQMLLRSLGPTILTVLVAAACGTSFDVEVVAAPTGDVPTVTPTAGPTVTPDPSVEPSPTAEPTTEPTAEPTATATPTASPTPTPVPTAAATASPTPTATPTPTPTASPTPVPIEFVIAPNGPILGVAIGTDADAAVDALVALIGPPAADSGWYQGCPLDGDDLNERLVQWGDLNVYFDRFDGTEKLRAWGYDVRVVDGGFPEPALIKLPGGGQIGDPVDEVAAAAGLPVVYDEVFDLNRVGEPGYEIVADASPAAPVWGAFVPFVPVCE